MSERVLVCGSRDWTDRDAVFQVLDTIHENSGIVRIIEGDCRGADRMAGEWAREEGVSLGVYPADWQTHKKAAGPIRNQQMLDSEEPTMVVAFHDDIDASKGTADMVRRARKAGVFVYLVGATTDPEAEEVG